MSKPAEVEEMPTEHEPLMRTLRIGLSKAHHDLNNPLAIISGNAEFLRELVRAMELNDELEGPIQDIEQACVRMEETMQMLNQLRDLLPE